MQFIPQRLPQTQNRAISDTFFSQLFLSIDNRRKIKSRKTRFVGRPPLSRLRRRFGPLRGTQRRCAALRAAPQGRYAPPTRCARPFLEHEKKAGKCIYEKGLFWLLLILRGAFFGRIFPSLAPRSGAFLPQKKAASALQIASFHVLFLRKMRPDPGPTGGRVSYASPG